jgi:3-dehydroquinate synthetase
MGWIRAEEVERIRHLFLRAGLPVAGPALGAEIYLHLMGLDKKVEGGRMRFVLLKAIGCAVIEANVPEDLLRQTLSACIKYD